MVAGDQKIYLSSHTHLSFTVNLHTFFICFVSASVVIVSCVLLAWLRMSAVGERLPADARYAALLLIREQMYCTFLQSSSVHSSSAKHSSSRTCLVRRKLSSSPSLVEHMHIMSIPDEDGGGGAYNKKCIQLTYDLEWSKHRMLLCTRIPPIISYIATTYFSISDMYFV